MNHADTLRGMEKTTRQIGTVMTKGEPLDYMQRKALRRLGRGQSITRTMENDSVIMECYSTDHYILPPIDCDIVEWCDWEARAWAVNRPRINERGKQLLATLDGGNNDQNPG